MPITDDIAAHLMIEVDGNNRDADAGNGSNIADCFWNMIAVKFILLRTVFKKLRLWKLRRRVAEAVKAYTIEKANTVVPRADLPVDKRRERNR